MIIGSLDDFTRFTKNRYEAIVVASKYARKMNEMLNEEVVPAEGEEEVTKVKMEEIVTAAMREVIEGKVKFERPEVTGRKF